MTINKGPLEQGTDLGGILAPALAGMANPQQPSLCDSLSAERRVLKTPANQRVNTINERFDHFGPIFLVMCYSIVTICYSVITVKSYLLYYNHLERVAVLEIAVRQSD